MLFPVKMSRNLGPTYWSKGFVKRQSREDSVVMNAPSFGVPSRNEANGESSFPTCVPRNGPRTRVWSFLSCLSPTTLTWHFLVTTLDSPLPPQVQCMRTLSSPNFCRWPSKKLKNLKYSPKKWKCILQYICLQHCLFFSMVFIFIFFLSVVNVWGRRKQKRSIMLWWILKKINHQQLVRFLSLKAVNVTVMKSFHPLFLITENLNLGLIQLHKIDL